MKNRWLLGIAVLVASTLGCGLFSLVGVNPVTINSVSVTPSTGSGTFTLSVLFRVRDEISDGEMVHCYYVTPDGGTTTIGDFIPEGFDSSHDVVFTTTQPGLYSAGCQSYRSGSSQTTTFTVTGNATPTPFSNAMPTPTANLILVPTPTSTPTLPSTPALTGGTITYDEATEQLSPHKNQWGYFPSQHHKWCALTLTIDSAGNISGTCSAEGHDITSGLYGDWNSDATIEGMITGTAIPGSSFTFREELIEKYKPGTSFESNRIVVILGTGSFSPGSATHATGTATLDADCRTVDNYANICGDYPSLDDHFTGTIAWEFNGTASP
jgi:hypothetical protein